MDMLLSEGGICMVCGDKSAGKHYGVAACYGCKGFFRRTIRANQVYSCRFNQKCMIDKDQRNACRSCRFQRCLDVGMEPDAIRPDRDVIGKQKNPRKRKIKREESSLPSPSLETQPQPTQFTEQQSQSDMLLRYLVDIDLKATTPSYTAPIGIANHPFLNVKSDPDSCLATLFQSGVALNAIREPFPGDTGRVATIDLLHQSMRQYVVLAVDWVNAIFELGQVYDVNDKIALLKRCFGAFCLFTKSIQTVHHIQNNSALILANGTVVPRDVPRHLRETHFFANNLVEKVLDEIVLPFRKLRISDYERAGLCALTILDGEYFGFTPDTANALNNVKQRIYLALFQSLQEQTTSTFPAANRFASLLLTLPSVAKLSALYFENAQMAKMFGTQVLDPYLCEILSNPFVLESHQQDFKTAKAEASTQTKSFSESDELGRIGHELVALGLDLSANPPMTVPPSENSASSTSSPIHNSSPPPFNQQMGSNQNLHLSNTVNQQQMPSMQQQQSMQVHKPPPLVVQHQRYGSMTSTSSSSHHSPVVSAPVYPFNYFNYNEDANNTAPMQHPQASAFTFDNVHASGTQSAGPFNNHGNFNFNSPMPDYNRQHSFKF
uniref:Nuclear receptor domain-containing protein n=1 Tax=Panagrellus redivivus TaxID=6233 RepID=A0A7E4VMP3_PANRE